MKQISHEATGSSGVKGSANIGTYLIVAFGVYVVLNLATTITTWSW